MTRLGLRSKLLLTNLVAVLVLTTILAAVASTLFETYEIHILKAQVAVDLDRLEALVARNPAVNGIDFGNSSGIVVSGSTLATLDPVLRALPPGIHEDVFIDGNEYFAGHRQVAGNELFVLVDAGPFESLEERLTLYGLVGLAAGALVAILASMWISAQVLRPFTALTSWLHSLKPGSESNAFPHRFEDPDIDALANTLESYVARIEDFIDREQQLTEDVSHELRTPLAVVQGAVTLLLDDTTLSPAQRQRAERIGRAARQMGDLIEAILFLAREDGGIRATPIALDALLADVVETRQDAARRAGVNLLLDVAAPVSVIAHPGMAASIIGNLLDNAIRHGGSGTVRVELTPNRLAITDQGPGIAPARIEAVFSRHTRGEGSRGLGLGLHIVQSLCHRLGWQITVEPVTTGGTRVALTFAAPPV